MRVLDKINCPKCLKSCTMDELDVLAAEIREVLINKINSTGGHMGSNLGIIEATIALHYVFNSPVDKIVFDVSHQSYTHKILTGRKEYFIEPAKFNILSGYTTPSESVHDAFKVGHTSTSVSLACGLAKGRDLLGENYNVVAVIGDGSLSGGEAFEGLNNAGMFKSNMIIVVNDNEMSIAPNQGALYDNLKMLRESNGACELNFFKTLGLDYRYLDDGNNVRKLVEMFESVKNIDHPVVVHIHTLKGKGLPWAEENKELGHWEKGKFAGSGVTYQELTTNYLQKEILKNPKLFVITAATPTALGLHQKFRDTVKERFVDVGICEEHALSFASGAACSGCVPIICINSSFFQRAYDELQQDIALNNSHVVILVYNGKITGGDATHNGAYDIAFSMSVPNVCSLAPSSVEEYYDCLHYAIHAASSPVIVRVPSSVVNDETYQQKDLFEYQLPEQKSDILVMGLGNFYHLAKRVQSSLLEKGVTSDVINPVIYSELTSSNISKIKNYKTIVVLEDGIVSGGFGSCVASSVSKYGVKVLCYGQDKDFNDLVSLDDIYEKCHLREELIVDDILS